MSACKIAHSSFVEISSEESDDSECFSLFDRVCLHNKKLKAQLNKHTKPNCAVKKPLSRTEREIKASARIIEEAYQRYAKECEFPKVRRKVKRKPEPIPVQYDEPAPDMPDKEPQKPKLSVYELNLHRALYAYKVRYERLHNRGASLVDLMVLQTVELGKGDNTVRRSKFECPTEESKIEYMNDLVGCANYVLKDRIRTTEEFITRRQGASDMMMLYIVGDFEVRIGLMESTIYVEVKKNDVSADWCGLNFVNMKGVFYTDTPAFRNFIRRTIFKNK